MSANKAQVREAKPKRIIRSSHNDQAYFLMVRSTAQDDRLSWAARGMLAYLLSKPDDWTIEIKDLQQGCGRDKVYGLLNELIEYRYVARIKVTGDKHQIESIDYYVYECPLPENTEEVKPLPYLPYTEKPDTENTDSYIVQNMKQNTESTSLEPAVPVSPQINPEPTILKEVLKDPTPVSGDPPSQVDKRTPHQRGVDCYYDGIPADIRPKVKHYGGQVGSGIKELIHAGYTPEQIGIATAEAYKDDWWSEKIIPVQKVAENMEILLRKAKFNGTSSAHTVDDKYIPDPDNPAIKITRAQLAARERNKAIIEAEYGTKSA